MRDGGLKHVNQYTIVDTVGRGSYGKVKRCMSKTDGVTYAAKIITKSILKRKRVGRFGTALDNVKKEIRCLRSVERLPRLVSWGTRVWVRWLVGGSGRKLARVCSRVCLWCAWCALPGLAAQHLEEDEPRQRSALGGNH